MNSAIADIRKEYKLRSLDETEVAAHPIDQFTHWWEEAVKSDIGEVNAMTLATVSEKGLPSARIVLLKGYDRRGFMFFTNYHSQKGKEMAINKQAALVFFWKELERQIRIEGVVEKTTEAESNAYYDSRPSASRIGAWASPQSEIIAGRQVIEEKFQEYEKKFSNASSVPRPPHWGGYLLKPVMLEFWQGRRSRLHDRIQYTLQPGNQWKIQRLAP